ncbi:MAG: CPBP family intramembrane metalloprotease [Anaerolineales bacterium]|nr:CPBP family intramembrane metalloprotease [Anaerolineales bacterium]
MGRLHTIPSFIFLTNDKSRLRAGWRIMIAVILTGLFFNIVDWIRNALSISGPTTAIVGSLIDFTVVTSAIFLARRFADKRSFTSLGFRINKQAGLDILVGFAIPLILFLIIYLIEYSMGWLTFKSFAWKTESPSIIIFQTFQNFVRYIFVAWNEELIYRGYIMQSLASGFNLTWGILISSIYFGIEHLSNPNSNGMAVAGIFLAGLFLAYGYMRTGQLWLSIGLHLGWNFFESAVFGFPVSGYDRLGLLNITVSGPEFWTGGAFGPEAGFIILPINLIGVILVYLYTKHRLLPSSLEY